MFSAVACIDSATHKTFQVKCSLNCHVVISGCVLRALKDFGLAKSAQDLDVNFELSSWEAGSQICGKKTMKALNVIY